MSEPREMTHTEQDAKTAAAKKIAVGSLILALTVPVAAMVAENEILPVSIAAAFFVLLGFGGAMRRSPQGRVLVAAGLIGQAICLTAAFAGHPWQLDMHMLFFGLLAVLMVLAEPLVIVAAVAMIAVHHLSLSVFMPALVYPSLDIAESLQRTILHAVIVLIEGAVLFAAIRRRNLSLQEATDAANRLSASESEVRQSLEQAKAAQFETETALQAAQAAQQEATAAREATKLEAEKARTADREVRLAEQKQAEERAKVAKQLDQVVSQVSEALTRLSEGDLTCEIENAFPQEYERLRQDLNTTVLELQSAIGVVKDNTATIVADVVSIEDAANQLAQRTESQAGTLEETTAAVHQISQNAKLSADIAREANDVVGQALTRAEQSDRIVSETVEAMSEIEASSQQISKIVSVIENIAFQTNLLALNAGVEAARAGEAGRGFAVVASEVRELAQRSSEAAQEIGNLIAASGRHVSAGVTLVNDTGGALKSISAAVENVSARMQDILRSVDEQSLSVSETRDAMLQLENVTQQNAAMFEETNAVTQSLAKQADELNRAVAKFGIPQDSGHHVTMHATSSANDPDTPNETRMTAQTSEGSEAMKTLMQEELDDGWEAF